MKGYGFSGLGKLAWLSVPLFLWNAYAVISNGVRDNGDGGSMNFGSSVGMLGITGVVAAFVVRDWFLMWQYRREGRGLRLDREGMRRDPRHPDWLRAYQKKTKI